MAWHGVQRCSDGELLALKLYLRLQITTQPIDIDSFSKFQLHLTSRRVCVARYNHKGARRMAGTTLTRSDLSEAVYREIGLSRNESSEMVETVLSRISDALVKGENVKISSFGTFAVREKGARMGRNPKTGEEVPIDPRRVLVFRPSHIMKDRVNAGGVD